MEKKNRKAYRVAIVGCGAIAPIHVAAILESGNEICGLCDKDQHKADTLKEKFSLQRTQVFTDYEQMLSEIKPDALHICTPHYLHASMAIAALKMNIHVLCEKPLAINKEQIKDILKAEKTSKAVLGVCLQNRYSANYRKLKELADSVGVKAAFGDVVWNRDDTYYASGDWRGKWETEGGGVMINQAIHTLDLLEWICGMPETVTAHCFNDHLQDSIEVEDTAVGRFCTDGSVFQIYATTGSAADFSAHIRVKLKDGTVIHAENYLLNVSGNSQPIDRFPSAGGKEVWGDGHKALIADFYDCIAEEKRFLIDGSEGAKVIRLVLGMYESNGNEISIPKL